MQVNISKNASKGKQMQANVSKCKPIPTKTIIYKQMSGNTYERKQIQENASECK